MLNISSILYDNFYDNFGLIFLKVRKTRQPSARNLHEYLHEPYTA